MVAVSCFISISATHAANPSATTVSVVIPALVQISGLSDITLAPISFGSPVTGATTACIYTNVINPLGSYYVTAISTNASAGVFRVTNGANLGLITGTGQMRITTHKTAYKLTKSA